MLSGGGSSLLLSYVIDRKDKICNPLHSGLIDAVIQLEGHRWVDENLASMCDLSHHLYRLILRGRRGNHVRSRRYVIKQLLARVRSVALPHVSHACVRPRISRRPVPNQRSVHRGSPSIFRCVICGNIMARMHYLLKVCIKRGQCVLGA